MEKEKGIKKYKLLAIKKYKPSIISYDYVMCNIEDRVSSIIITMHGHRLLLD